MTVKYTIFRRNLRLLIQLLLVIAFLAMAFVARSQAIVQTDQTDYAPGSIVYISGSGWSPGEGVVLQVLHPGDSLDNTISPSGAHLPWTIQADGQGNISAQWTVPTDEDELGATLVLSAKGLLSGSFAEWTFTDANTRFIVSGLPSGISVTVNFGSTSSMNSSTTFSSGGSNASSQFVYVGTMYFAFPGTLASGSDVYVLISTDKSSPATIGATGAYSITATYELQGGSGGLSVTAPVCAQGGAFTITYIPAQGGQAVTETRTTPYSFTAKKNTAYSITAVQNHNGNTYTGPATVNGTTPNTNGFQETVTLSFSDTQPPTLTLPAPSFAANDPGVCYALVSTPAVTFGDNCSGPLLSWVMGGASGGSGTGQVGNFNYGIGQTSINYLVTDAAGNKTAGIAYVTITDNEPPQITAPAGIQAPTDPGQCSANIVDLGVPVVQDNCGTVTFTSEPSAPFPLGITQVKWTATDYAGNKAVAYQQVSVYDAQLPAIVAPADVVVNTDPGSCSATDVDLGIPVTSDNCSISSVTNDAPASFDIGNTTVTWKVTDGSGNSATAVQTVKVVDNEFPGISLPDNMMISACEPVPYWKGKATDNCSVSISGPFYSPDNSFAPGTTTTISYYAIDGSGNRTDASFTITRAPALLASAVITTPVQCNGGTAVITVSASGGTPPYTGTGTFNKPAGTHSFIVTDEEGCTATATLTVSEPAVVVSTFATNNGYLYFGYTGDQSAQITAKPSGGVGPYTVRMTMDRNLLCNMITASGDELWSASSGGSSANNVCPSSGSISGSPSVEWSNVNAGATVTLNVTLMRDAKFTLVVTDSKGCTYTSSTLTGGGPNGGVDAEDVRCFSASLVQKVQICHRTGSAKNPCVTICVDESAVADHIAHGDYYGKCNSSCTAPVANARVVEDGATGSLDPMVSVFPNPFSSAVTVKVNNPTAAAISMQMVDLTGKDLNISQMPGDHENEFILLTEPLPVGIHVLRVSVGKQVHAVKIMKQ